MSAGPHYTPSEDPKKESVLAPLPVWGDCWHSFACDHNTHLCFHGHIAFFSRSSSSAPLSVLNLPLPLSHTETSGWIQIPPRYGRIISPSQDPKNNHIYRDLFIYKVTFIGSQELTPDIFGQPLFNLLESPKMKFNR